MANDVDVVARDREAVWRGDWNGLVADYSEDMVFVMPGQNDVLAGRAAFRDALNDLGSVLSPGFEMTSLRQIGENGAVVSIVGSKSEKIPGGSRLAVLFELTDGKVAEVRWFVETERWKAAL